jgi:aspartate dehydrogenase
MRSVRIGIIGHGALASRLIEQLRVAGDDVQLSGILVRSEAGLNRGAMFDTSLNAFLARSHDVVVECAGQAALRDYVLPILSAGVDLVPASIGALVDASLVKALRPCAALSGAKLRLPSGAMVGLDGLAAARHGGIDSVFYRGTMAPGTLVGFDAPADARALAFRGTAREAVARFPKNANLTGTIALVGIGFDRTEVELWTDPATTFNLHDLKVRGAFGDFDVRVRGVRISPASPSSRLVAGSLLQAALGSNYTVLTTPPGAS